MMLSDMLGKDGQDGILKRKTQPENMSYVWSSLQDKYIDLWNGKKLINVAKHHNIKKGILQLCYNARAA